MKQDDFIFPSHSCLPTGFLPCLGTAGFHIYEAATGGSFVRPPFLKRRWISPLSLEKRQIDVSSQRKA
ncbi:uncharacterized protein CCOS01_06201 [Colletotrichum costaricense]|uniref:Uncharacterized protein n=1 Tax=Colletotrichum costaricense TaxID=1209916 RepID=A0AAI9Z1Y5_9PEZI|nr:uncharacterized protein CCOS01_06201 [Colletotrichum costaricense]KAK1531098.1 hypothetical protein CCOS01_06201 [Colletotrichum costaricense]